MNDRATVTAVSLFPTAFAVFLLSIAPGELSAQPSASEGDSAASRPQRAAPIFQFQERPGSTNPGSSDSRTQPAGNGQPSTSARQTPAQRPANDPMRFQPAPPPTPRATETRTTEAPPPTRDPAPAPQRAVADPMRFQPAPPPPKAPVEEPKSRPTVADVPKSQAAPAPIRTAPAPRFEVRAPESRSEDVYPGSDEVVAVDEPPQFNATELTRNVRYPEDALRDGIQGRVLVRVLINRQGQVLRRIVEYSSNHALDTAAVSAVAATRFIPAKKGGGSVAAWITVPVNFVLNPEATEQRGSY